MADTKKEKIQRLKFFFTLIFLLSFCHQIQAQNFFTGCLLDSATYAKVPLADQLKRGKHEKLPTYFSLKAYAPFAKNQEDFGNCVGWSTTYMARTMLRAIQNNWTNTSFITENAFSPFFVYEKIKTKDDVNCKQGSSFSDALEALKNIGTVKYTDFKDPCGKAIEAWHLEKATQAKIKDYRRLFESHEKDKVSAIKQSLIQKKTVMIGVKCCTESFMQLKSDFWQMSATDSLANIKTGHALLIVAYDDKKGKNGAFEVMNTWGTQWANQGFAWVPYEWINQTCEEAYEMLEDKQDILLAGEAKFILSSGEVMPTFLKEGIYEMLYNYPQGSLFKIYTSHPSSTYLYAFSLNEEGNISIIFNAKSSFITSNPSILPSEESFIKMDTSSQEEYMVLLYSNIPLDIYKIQNQLLQEFKISKNLLATIEQTLEKNRIQRNRIYYSPYQTAFKLNEKSQGIIPMIVKIKYSK